MKQFFQKLALSIFFAFVLAACLVAQEKRSTSVVFIPADSIFKVVTVITLNADTTGITFSPQGGLTAAQVAPYLFQLSLAVDNRLALLENERKELNKEKGTYRGMIDTLFGAGTFTTLTLANLRQVLQGDWLLLEKNGKVIRYRPTVTGETITDKDGRAGKFTVLDEKTVAIDSFLPDKLTLSLNADGDAFEGEAAGKKYTLRRPQPRDNRPDKDNKSNADGGNGGGKKNQSAAQPAGGDTQPPAGGGKKKSTTKKKN